MAVHTTDLSDALSGTQLLQLKQLSTPMAYYGPIIGFSGMKIAYISDMHLDEHLTGVDANIRNVALNHISRSLFQSLAGCRTIAFLGDAAADRNLVLKFYHTFTLCLKYEARKRFKMDLERLRALKAANSRAAKALFKEQQQHFREHIESRMTLLADYPGFDLHEYRHYIFQTERLNDIDALIDFYQKTACELPDYERLHNLVDLVTELKILERDEASFLAKKKSHDAVVAGYEEIKRLEERHGKKLEKISSNDFEERYNYSIFVILGNHEYSDLDSEEQCISFYASELKKMGIILLQNTVVENKHLLVYGGTGFAKYNLRYNADTLIGAQNFTRAKEEQETTVFEQKFVEILEYAKDKNKMLVCLSHYPVEDCLNGQYAREVIYFNGHNHHNQKIKTEDIHLYADNQIGYTSTDFRFKIATSGYTRNPYRDLCDGFYRTTWEEYAEFYTYLGDYAGAGKRICDLLESEREMYVIKKHDYYGFFLVSNKAKNKSISIINGSAIKKITKTNNIENVYKMFDVVLFKYLQAMIPVRSVQEQISHQLKQSGFSGRIHGLIVDIDFEHHIMLNPLDGTITFYYSPYPGSVQRLSTFDSVLRSIAAHTTRGQANIDAKYQQLVEQTTTDIIATINGIAINDIDDDGTVYVDLKTGVYRASRVINKLQGIFNGHVLKEFDMALGELTGIE